jgi:16S rRNA (cytosine1402-N4)-methyltransferase
MRMDAMQGRTAAEYLSSVREEELSSVLLTYGDLGRARALAAAIIRRREAGRLKTTRDLAEAVAQAFHMTHGYPDETRRVFMAVRMALNEEPRWLETGLRQALDALAPKGRIIVIAFHSGEDRVSKNVLREASASVRELYPDGRVRETHPARFRLLTRKPIQPGAAEIARNPRSHSARLRVAERLCEEEVL